MRRGLLVIALGILFLVGITVLGTVITNYVPATTTPQSQTARVGLYTITMRVDPYPPSIEQPATLSLHLQQSATDQPINDAQLTIDGSMAEMEMGVPSITANALGAGNYRVRIPFSMSGLWQIQVSIALPRQPELHTAFSVHVQ